MTYTQKMEEMENNLILSVLTHTDTWVSVSHSNKQVISKFRGVWECSSESRVKGSVCSLVSVSHIMLSFVVILMNKCLFYETSPLTKSLSVSL